MLTLQQIRDQSPYKGGWTKLLKSLGSAPILSQPFHPLF